VLFMSSRCLCSTFYDVLYDAIFAGASYDHCMMFSHSIYDVYALKLTGFLVMKRRCLLRNCCVAAVELLKSLKFKSLASVPVLLLCRKCCHYGSTLLKQCRTSG
jgi:hypothetical protein